MHPLAEAGVGTIAPGICRILNTGDYKLLITHAGLNILVVLSIPCLSGLTTHVSFVFIRIYHNHKR